MEMAFAGLWAVSQSFLPCRDEFCLLLLGYGCQFQVEKYLEILGREAEEGRVRGRKGFPRAIFSSVARSAVTAGDL